MTSSRERSRFASTSSPEVIWTAATARSDMTAQAYHGGARPPGIARESPCLGPAGAWRAVLRLTDRRVIKPVPQKFCVASFEEGWAACPPFFFALRHNPETKQNGNKSAPKTPACERTFKTCGGW